VSTRRGRGSFFPAAAAKTSQRGPREKGAQTKSARLCARCQGPMPPPAWTGRPRIYCSVRCRAEAAAIRWAEQERRDQERRAAEEAERAAAERRRNLRAGGVRRLEQLQADAWDARRCGWFEAGDSDVCQRRVTRAYLAWCREHTKREAVLEEEAEEAEIAAFEAEEAEEARKSDLGGDVTAPRIVLPHEPWQSGGGRSEHVRSWEEGPESTD
jgi:hypothetical protein